MTPHKPWTTRIPLFALAFGLGLAGCSAPMAGGKCAETGCPAGSSCGPDGYCVSDGSFPDMGGAQPDLAEQPAGPAPPSTFWTSCGGGSTRSGVRQLSVTVGGAPAGRELVAPDGRRLRLGRLVPNAY